ncbi:MAG TPA: methyltransferase domain-containing protein, partial [Thermoanaerobaculia bacterium]|nr:methyltransferase domain-containing protein [Thermoanaerobaculia bacterium]
LDAVRFAMQEAEAFARDAAAKLSETSAEASRLKDELSAQTDTLRQRVEALDGSRAAYESARKSAMDGLAALERELSRHVEAFGAEIRKADERLDALEKDRDARFEALARRHERQDEAERLARAATAGIEEDLRRTRLEWSALRQELKGGLNLATSTASGTPSASDPCRAGLYADFEAHFRGSEDEIRRRQVEDVALFAGAPGPVADLGCGRGEFLEALRSAGIAGIGCDANALFVARAAEKGLAVDKADLFAWLASREDGSLGGVTAYQVVEHLPTAALLDLVELAVRKLAPKGRLLFETVNPESVYAMKWFWMDLTHVRPVPAPSHAHLMTQAGLKDVKVDFRSPVPEAEGLSLDAAKGPLAPVARLLFAPQDYAVTGVK